MISSLARGSRRLTALFGVAALVLLPEGSLAAVGQHSTLASFQASVRGNLISQEFIGAGSDNVPDFAFGSGGFAASIDSENPVFGMVRIGNRLGSALPAEGTRLTFSGRPVSAFAGQFSIIEFSNAAAAGTIVIVTDTGESVSVAVPVGGAFAGITASRPFTSVTFNTTTPGSLVELIGTAFIGISANAAELADQCSDAVAINPITAVEYPFNTAATGVTATSIAGSCTTSGLNDNGPDVWVRMVPTVYGDATITTCGATFDTILRVFASCGPAGDGVGATQIVCNDDFCAGGAITGSNLASRVQLRVEAGEDYLVRVSGFSNAVGGGNLTFSVVPDCAGDFNHSGGRDVSDIFSFLSAWFAGCP